MRMARRLRCAGRARGASVELEREEAEFGEVAVHLSDALVIDGLVDTEEIERLLEPVVGCPKRHSGNPARP